ncbi:hypothetical protein [Amycolatopsis panacis]|nr:hypothetical protein [Amycolatopsis panacis]
MPWWRGWGLAWLPVGFYAAFRLGLAGEGWRLVPGLGWLPVTLPY